MTTVLWITLGVYLFLGALVAFAYMALNMGTRGSGPGLQGNDIVMFPVVMVCWLPYILGVVFKYCALIILPMRWTNRWR